MSLELGARRPERAFNSVPAIGVQQQVAQRSCVAGLRTAPPNRLNKRRRVAIRLAQNRDASTSCRVNKCPTASRKGNGSLLR